MTVLVVKQKSIDLSYLDGGSAEDCLFAVEGDLACIGDGQEWYM